MTCVCACVCARGCVCVCPPAVDLVTPMTPYKSINPKINYSVVFACTVTEEFVKHVGANTMDVFVYGSAEPAGAVAAYEEPVPEAGAEGGEGGVDGARDAHGDVVALDLGDADAHPERAGRAARQSCN